MTPNDRYSTYPSVYVDFGVMSAGDECGRLGEVSLLRCGACC